MKRSTIIAWLHPRLPFLLHALLELPASLKFLLSPSSGLPDPLPPAAEALMRQYGVLLFSTVVIALLMAFRDHADRNTNVLSSRVAGALGLYHVAPALRAVGRIRAGDGFEWADLGGAPVHLALHVFVGEGLLWRYFVGWADGGADRKGE